MAIVNNADGLQNGLTALKTSWLTSGVAHLFVNNHTPVVGDTAASYTEPSWAGYSAQSLTTWGSVAWDTVDHAFVDSDTVSFDVGGDPGSEVVYGYYVTISGILQYAEKFATTITPVQDIPVQLFIRYKTGND